MLALWQARESHHPLALVTTVTREFARISMHGVRVELLRRQAESLGIPLTLVEIPYPCVNGDYEKAMHGAWSETRTKGAQAVICGDPFLDDVRRYREERLFGSDACVFPLWLRPRTEVAASASCARGAFRIAICCRSIDDRTHSSEWECVMLIQSNTFLVSGGASGLGAACVRILANGGGNVVIADINRAAGEALAADLGATVRFAVADVTDEASVQAAVDLATRTFGGLHGSIQCAGIALAEKVHGKTGPNPLTTFVRTIQINLIGTYNVVRLASAAMMQNQPSASGERGVVINTASVAAFDGQIGQAAYSASKGGVVGMTLPLARELARYGIRVMTIAPGIFDTPLLAALPEAARDSLAQQVPFPPRLGRPDEYAALARHIVENEMLNGEIIRLDGAIRMPPK
jgi:NAD(P)-dependent dehydrogenase (short-subunit alcohol dehydrogenase family)